MTVISGNLVARLTAHPSVARGLQHLVAHGLMDLNPWTLLIAGSDAVDRSDSMNLRYPSREVVCFAARRDTDDIACVVIASSGEFRAGEVIIVHDFASAGFEVDAVFADFWAWFRGAVEDLVDAARRMEDHRAG